MKRSEKAEELFRSGMNCSQAVFCAFADEFGMDAETAAKVACGLGGGVGRMREVCGAASFSPEQARRQAERRRRGLRNTTGSVRASSS